MKQGVKKLLLMSLTAGLLASLVPGTAFGATKVISSVSVRVGMNLEAGDYLPSSIDTSTYNSTAIQSDTEAYVATNSTKYSARDADWVTSTNKVLNVGDRPRMKIYLWADDSDYGFRGSYSSSNVTVKGGTLVSARRNSYDELELVVALNGVKGQYVTPASAGWKNSGYGKAQWNQENSWDDEYSRSISSGYYDVYLYCGKTLVKKLEDFQGTSYDFYPYMTKAGTYFYRVRTVPHTADQKQYGQKSEWLDSDEIYIDAQHVSDGRGQTDGNGISTSNGQVGWISSGGAWYYRYPDGSYLTNGWAQVGGVWYLFDTSGKMLTGWQTKDGLTYFLQDNGAMYTGWLKAGEMWYYMNQVGDDGVEGAMRKGWLTRDNRVYYLKSDGSMAEGWSQVDGNMYYFYPGYGYRATNTYIDGFWVDADGIWRKQ